MSKKNLNVFTNWIKTASVVGLETVMVDLSRSAGRFTPEQQNQIQALINKDDVHKSAARLSAATSTEGLNGYETVKPLVETMTFEEAKAYFHTVDTRVKSLPPNQAEAIFTQINQAALSELLASMGLPNDGQYIDDVEDATDEDTL